MSFISGIMLGLVLFYLTRVDVLAVALGLNKGHTTAITIFVLLSVGFFGIRFFGQGMMTMVSRNMVMKWFNKRRGMANAVLGIFVALGFAIAPKLLNQIVLRLEWRGAWIFLALMAGIVFALFVLIVFRDNPEDCGCEADGNMKVRRRKNRPPSLPERDFTLKEAQRTIAFWAFTLGLALTALYISGFTFHIISVFESAGMDGARGLDLFIPTSLIAVAIQFAGSYASDFIKLKYLLFLFMGGMFLTATGLVLLGDREGAYGMIVAGNGIVWGLYSVLIGVTWPRFFGLKHLGAISGLSMSITVIGSSLGPYMFSLSNEWSGSYDIVGWVCLAIAVLVLLVSFRADNPSE
jgi:MFS family permease